MSIEYIYGLVCPIKNEVMYVGRSIDPTVRFYQHMVTPDTDSSRRAEWLRSLREKNLRPELAILSKCDSSEAKERERKWIAYYHRENPDLTNTLLPDTSDIVRITLRLPPDLYELISDTAEHNMQSVNGVIVTALGQSIDGLSDDVRIESLEARIAALEAQKAPKRLR